jgi:hypothetical protein
MRPRRGIADAGSEAAAHGGQRLPLAESGGPRGLEQDLGHRRLRDQASAHLLAERR